MHGTPDFLGPHRQRQRVLGIAFGIDKRDCTPQQHDFLIIIKKIHLLTEAIGSTRVPAIQSRDIFILLFNLEQSRIQRELNTLISWKIAKPDESAKCFLRSSLIGFSLATVVHHPDIHRFVFSNRGQRFQQPLRVVVVRDQYSTSSRDRFSAATQAAIQRRQIVHFYTARAKTFRADSVEISPEPK